jgi:peptide/nickel transport system permease protein
MGSFLVGKIGQYLLVLWIAITLNFLLPRMMPGNPLALIAGEDINRLSAEQRAALIAQIGLDQPLAVQYIRYLQNSLQGDFGYSYQWNQPVLTLIGTRLPWTLLLAGSGLLLSTVIGVALGALAAWRRGGRRDVGTMVFFLFLESLPAFWVGMLLVALFAVRWPIFPTFGATTPWLSLSGWAYVADVLHHLVLPLATLTIVSVSGTFIVARSAMMAVLGEEFITVARAKGLAERQVLFRHALRNALLPIATIFTLNLAFAFSGATVIETVFSYPGVGRLIFEAVLSRDYPVLQAAFMMITVLVVIANIMTDAIYPLLDPRVRSHARSARGVA